MDKHNGVKRNDPGDSDSMYLAGQKVPAGTYREIGTFRSIHLESEDYLPASLNGKVAVYVKKPITFAELLNTHLHFGKAS